MVSIIRANKPIVERKKIEDQKHLTNPEEVRNGGEKEQRTDGMNRKQIARWYT